MIDGIVNLLDEESKLKRLQIIKDRESKALAVSGQGKICVCFLNYFLIFNFVDYRTRLC